VHFSLDKLDKNRKNDAQEGRLFLYDTKEASLIVLFRSTASSKLA